MWPFRKKRLCDLSELWEGQLEITIEGLGVRIYNFDRDNLATHVALVAIKLGSECIFVNNIKKSPWEIVSFDRQAKRLVVKPV